VAVLTRREARELRLDSADAPPVDIGPLDEAAADEAAERAGRGSRVVAAQTTVRILVVCTGNVIRSALAERALRQQFALIAADRFVVSSAGTRAAVGQGMWRESVEIARAYGFDYRDFVARQLDDDVLNGVDYVIVAAREHRESVLRRRPDLMRRTFTFREFVRILDDGAPPRDEAHGTDAVARWIELASWADRQRVAHRAIDPADDDLVDPSRGGREALWTFERDLITGVVAIVSAVAGESR
jgi:protein-tyrosine phosphatase